MIFQTTFQSSENQFQTAFASPTSTFAITFGSVVGVAAEVYKGDYTVTPSVTDQLLLTKEKMLKDNMCCWIEDIHNGRSTTIFS